MVLNHWFGGEISVKNNKFSSISFFALLAVTTMCLPASYCESPYIIGGIRSELAAENRPGEDIIKKMEHDLAKGRHSAARKNHTDPVALAAQKKASEDINTVENDAYFKRLSEETAKRVANPTTRKRQLTRLGSVVTGGIPVVDRVADQIPVAKIAADHVGDQISVAKIAADEEKVKVIQDEEAQRKLEAAEVQRFEEVERFQQDAARIRNRIQQKEQAAFGELREKGLNLDAYRERKDIIREEQEGFDFIKKEQKKADLWMPASRYIPSVFLDRRRVFRQEGLNFHAFLNHIRSKNGIMLDVPLERHPFGNYVVRNLSNILNIGSMAQSSDHKFGEVRFVLPLRDTSSRVDLSAIPSSSFNNVTITSFAVDLDSEVDKDGHLSIVKIPSLNLLLCELTWRNIPSPEGSNPNRSKEVAWTNVPTPINNPEDVTKNEQDDLDL